MISVISPTKASTMSQPENLAKVSDIVLKKSLTVPNTVAARKSSGRCRASSAGSP